LFCLPFFPCWDRLYCKKTLSGSLKIRFHLLCQVAHNPYLFSCLTVEFQIHFHTFRFAFWFKFAVLMMRSLELFYSLFPSHDYHSLDLKLMRKFLYDCIYWTYRCFVALWPKEKAEWKHSSLSMLLVHGRTFFPFPIG